MKYTPDEAKFALDALSKERTKYIQLKKDAENKYLEKIVAIERQMQEVDDNIEELDPSYTDLVQAWQNAPDKIKEKFYEERFIKYIMGI